MIARGNEFQSLIAIYHHLYSAKGGGHNCADGTPQCYLVVD